MPLQASIYSPRWSFSIWKLAKSEMVEEAEELVRSYMAEAKPTLSMMSVMMMVVVVVVNVVEDERCGDGIVYGKITDSEVELYAG